MNSLHYKHYIDDMIARVNITYVCTLRLTILRWMGAPDYPNVVN